MASNQTANFGLNQWSAEDKVLREEFNADNAKIDAALAGMPKIAFGSYVGTGKYGSSNPNTLSFPFAPKLVLISNSQAIPGLRQGIVGWFYGYNAGASDNDYNTESVTLIWEEHVLKWYSSTNANAQINMSGVMYQYCAIG